MQHALRSALLKTDMFGRKKERDFRLQLVERFFVWINKVDSLREREREIREQLC